MAHMICAGFHLIALATFLQAETKCLATVNTYVIPNILNNEHCLVLTFCLK